MKKSSVRLGLVLPPVVCSACLVFASVVPCAHAATSNWLGTSDGNFTNAGNWSNGVPGGTVDTTDTAVFNAASANSNITLGTTAYDLGSISFIDSASAYTFGGAGSFELTSGGSISMAGNVQNTQTFNLAISFRPGSYSFLNNSTNASAALVFNGTISASATGNTGDALTLGGSSTAANTVGGSLINGSGTSLLSLVKAGTGTWTLSGNNTYSGTTTINGGTLQLTNAAGSVSANGGNVTVNTGGTLAVGGNAAITGGAGSVLNLAGGTVQVIGSDLTTGVSTNLNGTLESFINTNGFNATFSGAVTGTGDLYKRGVGNLTFGNLATTGRLYIDAGTVISSGAANSVNYLRAVNGGTVGFTVNPNTVFTLNGTTAANPPSTARVIGGTTLNLTNNGQINVTHGTFAVSLSGLGAGTLNLGGTGTLDLDRVASGVYSSLYVGSGAGTVGSVTQSGSSVVNTGGVFLLGVDSGVGTYQLNDNSVLKSGTVWSAPHYYLGLNQSAGQTGTSGTLTVSGNSQFQLNANSYLDVGANLGGANAVGGLGTITQNGAGSLVTFGGAFAGFGSQGTGGTGTYNLQAGTFDLAAGTVVFGAASGATGTLNQSGGTLTAETGVSIGTAGTGRYNLTLGTATFFNGLNVGTTGIVFQTGGVNNIAGGTLLLGITTTAGYEVNGGILNIGGVNRTAALAINGSRLRVGNGAGSNGTLNLFDGSSITLTFANGGAPVLSIGRAGGVGVFNMTGGTVNALAVSDSDYSSLFIGNSSTGTVNQSGGTVTGGGVTLVADEGVGTYNLSGNALFQSPDGSAPGSHVYIGLNEDAATNGVTTGTVNVTGNATFTMRSQSYLDVGSNLGDANTTGGTGTITQNGAGSHVNFAGAFAGFGSQGAGGTGTYNLQAGTLDFAAGTVSFGASAGATGILNQSGGTLTAETGVDVGASGTGTYNLSGGTASFSNGLNVGATGFVNQTGGTDTIAGGTLTLANQNSGYEVNGGTLNIGSPTQTAAVQINSSKLRVGNGAGTNGTLNLFTGSTITLDASNNLAYLSIGRTGGTGVFNMSGGTVNALSVNGGNFSLFFVGASGSTGTVNQSGGTINGAATTIVGADGATGTYNLSGNALFQSPDSVSDNGSHVYIGLNQGDANAATNGTVNVTGNATFTMRSGSYLDVGVPLYGASSGGTGTITQNGAGSHVNFGGSFAGFGSQGAGGTGTYNLQAGALDLATGTVSFGDSAGATGLLNQSGGTLTAETGVTIANGGTGTYAISAGTATFSNGLSVGAASGSLGTLNQSGGTLTIAGGSLSLGQANSRDNLTGGTLQVGGANGINGAGTLSFGAGTVQVYNSNLTTSIATNLTAGVRSTINTNGLNATWNSPITGPSGGLTKTGAGDLNLAVAGNTIGSFYDVTGSVTQNAAASTVTVSELSVGFAAGNTATYNLSAGTFNTTNGTPPALVGGSAASLRVGDFGGTGIFNQTGGTANIYGSLNVGNQGGSGTYNLSAGSLNLLSGNGIGLYSLGRTTNANATSGTFNLSGTGLLNMSGDTFVVGDREIAGANGTGTFNQTGGTFAVNAGNLFLGGYGTSTYNLNGGTLQVGGGSLQGLYGANNNTGSYNFNLGGGTIQVIGSDLNTSVNANLTAGTFSTINTNGLNAIWNGVFTGPSGGLIKTGAGDLNLAAAGSTIGNAYAVAGSVTQNVATSSVTYGALQVGEGNGSTATYNLSAGTLNTVNSLSSLLAVGDFGGVTGPGAVGTFNQTGGTANVYGSLNIGNQGGSGTYNLSAGSLNLLSGNGGLYSLGRSNRTAAGTGVLNLSGTGVVNMSGDSFIVGDRESGGAQGVGTVNQTGGTFTVNGRYLYLGGYGNGNAYNLNGGTLQVGGNSLQGSYGTGTYAFNLGGGTVQVIGSNLNTSVNANLTAGTFSTINTNGFNAAWNGVLTGASGGFVKTGVGDLDFVSAGNAIGNAYVVAGSLTQDNASSSVTYGALQIGEGTGSTAVYNLSAGTLGTVVSGSALLAVGDFGGTGTVNQTGGTANVYGSFNVGNQGGSGTYNLSAGSLNLLDSNGLESLGRSNKATAGTGVLNLSGTGVVNMSADSFIVGDRESSGAQGVGTVNQTGGTFAVNSGTLYLGGYGANNAYNLNGGVLQVGGNHLQGLFAGQGANTSGSYSFNLGGGTLQVTGSDLSTNVTPTLTTGTSSTVDTNGLNATLNGVINGGGALVKAGAGTLNLPVANTYSGGTTVAAGSLLVSNASGSATGSGALTVSASGSLLGTGIVNATSNLVTINGTLSPGAGTGSNGTINIVSTAAMGALTLSNSSTLAFDLTSMAAKDLVALGGSSLSLAGGTLALNLGAGFDYSGSYAVFTGVSNLTGGFGTVTGYDASMYAPTFTYSGGEYDLGFTAVPEPTTVLGGILLVGAAGWTLRRRGFRTASQS